MRVLLLGPLTSRISSMLGHHDLFSTDRPISAVEMQEWRPDFMLSYGYRFVLSPHVLDYVEGRAINVHISLLPWNRGADPNLWSWLTNTPKGVSVHWIAPGLDSGDLVHQEPVELHRAQTLSETYKVLLDRADAAVALAWQQIERSCAPRQPQKGKGSYHRASDKTRHSSILVDGWDTPCGTIEDYGRRMGLWIAGD